MRYLVNTFKSLFIFIYRTLFDFLNHLLMWFFSFVNIVHCCSFVFFFCMLLNSKLFFSRNVVPFFFVFLHYWKIFVVRFCWTSCLLHSHYQPSQNRSFWGSPLSAVETHFFSCPNHIPWTKCKYTQYIVSNLQ